MQTPLNALGSAANLVRQDENPSNPLEELNLAQLRKRTSMKWAAHPENVLPLWVAEMDVNLAPPIAECLKKTVDSGDTGYPAGTQLAEAVKCFASERWGWNGLAVERTAIVPDVMMGIVEVLRLITDRGDNVVVSPPVYAPFYAFVSHDGRNIIEAPLGGDLRISMENLDKAFAQATAGGKRAAYLMSNPHNPTGTVHTAAELTAVAQLARAHGVRVISDEIHAPLILAGATFTPYLSVPGSENAFALTSASKAWNLAGLKAALAYAGEEAAEDLARMPEEVSHGPSHLGIIAHTVAFNQGRPWLDSLLQGLDDNRALLGKILAEHMPQVGYKAPEGTYLAWLDFSDMGITEEAQDGKLATVAELSGPAQFFIDHAQVALSSGHVFGSGGSGHARLNFATSKSILKDGLLRMASSLKALH